MLLTIIYYILGKTFRYSKQILWARFYQKPAILYIFAITW